MADPDARLDVLLGDFDNHGTTRAVIRGRSVEVEHGIPGETVRVELFGGKRPRARIVEVVEPSPDRVPPPCVYFRDWACGGCQWQHIDYPGQLERKRQQVDAAMRAAGLDVQVEAIHALDDPWRYRSNAGISLGRHAGFRRQASLAIVPIRDCPISYPLIGQFMAFLNDALADGRLPDFRGRLRLDVQVVDGPALQVYVRPTDGTSLPDDGVLAPLFETFASFGGIAAFQTAEAVSSSLSTIEVDGRPITVAAGAFFQTNVRLLPTLIARLRELLSPLREKHVADIYGGVGIFGLSLALDAARVTIVESDYRAVVAARKTADNWGLDNVDFVVGRAESVVEDVAGFDAVIVDPPRVGLAPALRRILAEQPRPQLLYVSCLAQSLARDLAELTCAYRVERLELFDFYPQTYHVELLATLSH